MNFILKISEKKLLDFLILITIIIFYYKLFVVNEHYPLHDEIIALDRYIKWNNFLRKDAIGNHTINSFIAVILNSIFGYNFINLRLISFASLIIILLLFRARFNSLFHYLICILAVTSSNILFNYSYIFRGYYVAAFLSIMTFFYLKKYFYNTRNINNLRILFLLIFLQLFHSLFTIYIAIPSLIMVSISVLKNKVKKEIIYTYAFFIIITISVYILFFFIDGFVSLYNSSLNFDFLFKNFLNIFIPCIISGFENIFFSAYTPSYFLALKDVFKSMYYGSDSILVAEPFFLIIYLLAFFIAILNFIRFRMSDYLSNTVLLIFIFFILLFKAPPLRVHTGTIFFCLFFIIDNINNFKIPYKNIISKISFILCLVLIINVTPNKNFQQTREVVMKIDKYKSNCIDANNQLTQYEIWILINYYPNQCRYKYDRILKVNILYNNRVR